MSSALTSVSSCSSWPAVNAPGCEQHHLSRNTISVGTERIEVSRQILIGVDIDLAEHDIRMLFRCRFEYRRERSWHEPQPAGPEIQYQGLLGFRSAGQNWRR